MYAGKADGSTETNMELREADLLVLQYLHERGFGMAAAAMGGDAGIEPEALEALPAGALRRRRTAAAAAAAVGRATGPSRRVAAAERLACAHRRPPARGARQFALSRRPAGARGHVGPIRVKC